MFSRSPFKPDQTEKIRLEENVNDQIRLICLRLQSDVCHGIKKKDTELVESWTLETFYTHFGLMDSKNKTKCCKTKKKVDSLFFFFLNPADKDV